MFEIICVIYSRLMVDEHVKLFESIFTDFLFGNYRLLSCPSFKFRIIKIRWQNMQKYDSASFEFSLFYLCRGTWQIFTLKLLKFFFIPSLKGRLKSPKRPV